MPPTTSKTLSIDSRPRATFRSRIVVVGAAFILFGAMTSCVAAQVGFKNHQAAAVVLGQPDFDSNGGGPNGTTTSQAGFNGVDHVIFDAAGNLWASDQCNSRILQFKPPFFDGMPAAVVIGEPDFTTTSSPGICFPDGGLPPQLLPTTASQFFYADRFNFDAGGNLWVADLGNNRILEFVPPFSTGMSPVLVIGQTDFTSSLPTTSATGLSFPVEPVFDDAGNMWASDIGNNRVVMFAPPFSTGMSASFVLGQVDFDSADCLTTQNGFCGPDDLRFDPSGNLWIADAFVNNRILEFKPPFFQGMDASVVIGQPDFISSDAGGGKAGLTLSVGVGIAFDANGDLWVSDSGNNRVMEFGPDFSNGMDAARVLGQQNFNAYDPATSAVGLWLPVGLGFDSSGNLWTTDANNNRIIMYTFRRGPH